MNNTNLILSDESEKMKNRELFEEYFSCSITINMEPDMAASHIPFQLVPKLQ